MTGLTIRTIILFLTFSIGLFSSDVRTFVPNAAQAAVVSKIQVVGNSRMDSDTVASYLTIEPGRKFSNGDIDQSVKELFATGLFRDVSIYRRGRILVVEVDENPTVNEVFFKGNKRLKDPALRAAIKTSSRSIFSEDQVISDVETISNAYSRVGREDATVRYEVVELTNNRVNVVFIMNEGDKTKIASINFSGNNALGDLRLKDIIKTKESNFLSFIRTDDIYDTAKIRTDEELLRRYYYNHGYADFQLISTIADLDPDRNEYNITFTVDEGPRYKFGEISIESTIPGLDTDYLYRELKIRTGGNYSARDVEDSIRALTAAVAAGGNAFVEVVPRGDRNFETNTIDVLFLIDEGPRVFIERIDIVGNDRTRDYVIRREFDISEGDALNQINVQTTQRRLEALGFFDQVSINTRRGSAPDRVVLVVRVKDKATGEFTIGGGYSTADGAVANIKFSERNFLGRGQYFAITGGFGTDDQEYRLAFTEPYFLGYRISAGIDITQSISDSSSNKTYSQTATSASLTFGIPVTEHLKANVFYRYGQTDITIGSSKLDPGGASPSDGIQGNTANEISAAIAPWQGNWVSSAAGYKLVFSDLDNVRNPREGIYASIRQEFAGIGGDAQYIKTDASILGYIPLSRDIDVVAFGRVRAGHIQSIGNQFRVLDNYFQGGRSIRGFQSYGFGPRDPITGDSLGGQTYFNATAELQFPIPLVPESLGIRGAIFADAGTLFNIDSASRALIAANATDMTQVDDQSIRASVGVSVIWDSPFGPIRFDYAEPIERQPWDKTRRFSFGASTAF